MQAVARDMAAVASDPGALSHDERDRLFARYNQAARQGPERRSTEVLRADLAGSDLGARMRAAVALQERGELDDATASEVVGSYNLEVRAAIERGPDPAELPEEFRPAAAAMQAELERLQAAERDPTEAALAMFNQAVRSVKPPTLEQQLAELGVNAEPEQVPEPVSSTSQEA